MTRAVLLSVAAVVVTAAWGWWLLRAAALADGDAFTVEIVLREAEAILAVPTEGN